MPLQLGPSGLLPPGVHTATLDEVEAAFGSSNDTRTELMANLRALCAIARSFGGVFKEIYVDGSFVTDKPVPSDVDAVLLMDVADFVRFAGNPHAFHIADSVRVKRELKIHLFVGPDKAPMIQFFQGIRAAEALTRRVPPSQQKGIIKVIL